MVITYNGEVYNHVELRAELEGKGHVFRTRSDTEVLVHAYEQWGESMLSRLNGQFAFAIYDRRHECLFLARDRFGVRPLFYAERSGDLFFASEMKALFATGEVPAIPDPKALDELFTVYAIVNAATVNLPAIVRVQILIDGKEADTLAGHVDIRNPLSKNLTLVKADKPS